MNLWGRRLRQETLLEKSKWTKLTLTKVKNKTALLRMGLKWWRLSLQPQAMWCWDLPKVGKVLRWSRWQKTESQCWVLILSKRSKLSSTTQCPQQKQELLLSTKTGSNLRNWSQWRMPLLQPTQRRSRQLYSCNKSPDLCHDRALLLCAKSH